MIIEVNRDNFENEVLQSESPVLLDFWGPRCQPCLALMPAVEELGKDFEGKLKIVKVNAAENRMLCARLRVMSLPSFLLYKDGVEVKRIGGDTITPKDLLEVIRTVLT